MTQARELCSRAVHVECPHGGLKRVRGGPQLHPKSRARRGQDGHMDCGVGPARRRCLGGGGVLPSALRLVVFSRTRGPECFGLVSARGSCERRNHREGCRKRTRQRGHLDETNSDNSCAATWQALRPQSCALHSLVRTALSRVRLGPSGGMSKAIRCEGAGSCRVVASEVGFLVVYLFRGGYGSVKRSF